MSSGFNTDVRIDERVFHIQTEARGASTSVIETAVYQSGRIVHRRSLSYKEFRESPDFSPEALRRRVEAQHRQVIEDLRLGVLSDEIAAAEQQSRAAAGIQVQLLNPSSWLSGGSVSLSLEILRRADRQPESGARVEAVIEGALEETRHSGTSDQQGRVQLDFPLPPLGKGDLALVILAQAGGGKDELRFAMRSRPKPPASDPAQ